MREYGLTLLVTAAITYLLTPLVRRIAIRIGAVPAARDRDVHAAPIPRMGGLAMYVGIAAGLTAAQVMVPLRDAFGNQSGLNYGLLGAGGLIVVLGIIDDRWGMNAIGKLAGQVAAAGILVRSGAAIITFPAPHDGVFGLTQNESTVLTILVVVATINAVNFIDGLDGLAAGVVFIAAMSFFVYYYSLAKVAHLPAEAVPALASIVLAGACLGFLPHNFFPARIFMGDTGSMLLGLVLAYIPIWAISSLDLPSLANKANRFPEILPLLLPAGVLVIPYLDMLRAVVRRTRSGLSPFAPDRKHLHHQLLEIGHSHRSSVLILYAWAAVFAGTVVGLSFVKTPLIFLAATTLGAVLVLALLSIPRLRWWERNRALADTAGLPAPAAVADPAPAVAVSATLQPGPATDVGPLPPPAARPVPTFTPAAALGAASNGHYAGESAWAAPEPPSREDQAPAPARPAAPKVSAWQGPMPGGAGGERNGHLAGEHQHALDQGEPGDLPPDATAPIPRPIARASGQVIP